MKTFENCKQRSNVGANVQVYLLLVLVGISFTKYLILLH